MQNARPEAEERLRRSFALTALAEQESINVDDKAVEAKLEEVKKEISADAKIDPERLRQAVMDDLIQDQLMTWLEENSTVTEKTVTEKTVSKKAAEKDSKPASKTKSATKKAPAKTKSKPDAES